MLRDFRIVLIGVLVIGSAGFISDPPTGTRVPLARLSSTPFSLALYSGIGQPERLVVRDNATWHTVWASIWLGTTPMPATPNVDFAKEMVIVAALGSRSTGGYSIVVDSAMATSAGLVVWIGTSSPGARCVTTQAFTAPVDVARIQRIDEPVRFVDVPKVVEC
jgi:hypothetical protein